MAAVPNHKNLDIARKYHKALSDGDFKTVEEFLQDKNRSELITVSGRLNVGDHQFPLRIVIQGLYKKIKELRHFSNDQINLINFRALIRNYLNIIQLLLEENAAPNTVLSVAINFASETSNDDFVFVDGDGEEEVTFRKEHDQCYNEYVVTYTEIARRGDREATELVKKIFEVMIEKGADFETSGTTQKIFQLRLISRAKKDRKDIDDMLESSINKDKSQSTVEEEERILDQRSFAENLLSLVETLEEALERKKMRDASASQNKKTVDESEKGGLGDLATKAAQSLLTKFNGIAKAASSLPLGQTPAQKAAITLAGTAATGSTSGTSKSAIGASK